MIDLLGCGRASATAATCYYSKMGSFHDDLQKRFELLSITWGRASVSVGPLCNEGHGEELES